MSSPPPQTPPPPLPVDRDFQVVNVASLTAALAKLNVDVSVEDLLEAIRKEDKARMARLNARHRAMRSEMALKLSEPIPDINPTPVSKSIPNPPRPANVDPLTKERRRRLIELTKEAFPDGFPEPRERVTLLAPHHQ